MTREYRFDRARKNCSSSSRRRIHTCGGTILQALQNVITNCFLLQLILPKIKFSVLEGFSDEQNAKI